MQTEAIFENIADRIEQELTQAEQTIYIAVAWFTNPRLFNALLTKAKQGITVQLIISNDPINQQSPIDYNHLNIGNSVNGYTSKCPAELTTPTSVSCSPIWWVIKLQASSKLITFLPAFWLVSRSAKVLIKP